MIFGPLVLSVLGLAVSATPVLSVESLLGEPIEARVRRLAGAETRHLDELRKIAFTAGAPLELRWRAVTTMGRLDRKTFAGALDRALKSPEWFLRNAALVAMLNADRATAVTASARALDDSSLMVRTQAVRNLIHFGARESEARLWTALGEKRNFSSRGESLWIRAHLAEALARLAGPGRTGRFRDMLDDRDPRLHRWAVRGLEASVGIRLSHDSEDVEVARRKWLARLGRATI